MVTCIKCKSKSRVVLTRWAKLQERDYTISRTRQCKTCRWKWKTIEIESKGKDVDIKI